MKIDQLEAQKQDLVNRNELLVAEKESIRIDFEEQRKRHQEELSRLELQINEQKARAARYYQVIVKQGKQDEGLDDNQLAKEFRELRYKVDNFVRNFCQAKKVGPQSRHAPWPWLRDWNRNSQEMRIHLATGGIFETLYREIFTKPLFGTEPVLDKYLALFESTARKSDGGKRKSQIPDVVA